MTANDKYAARRRYESANSLLLTILTTIGIWVVTAGISLAQSNSDVFTIANYPIEASATNAVTAKREATAQGRRAAFRSLLKRLIPAASYDAAAPLKQLDPEPFIRSMRIRSEENSSTQYIANIDFSFDPDTVRRLLAQHGVPYVDQAASPTSVLLIYSAPSTGASRAMSAPAGTSAWQKVWRGLDLGNSVAPLRLLEQPAAIPPETIKALLAADPAAVAALAAQHSTGHIIVVEAQPSPQSKELEVTVAGQDAVGRFSLRTRYRLDDEDFTYSLELAAVVTQGVLEGRWKTTRSAPSQPGGQPAGSTSALQVLAEFNDLGQWQRQQQILASTPGIRNMQIGSLSGRSASIELSFPGGGAALQAALVNRGLTLENINGFWILR